MPTKITQKIVSSSVVKPDAPSPQHLHEDIIRPDSLPGTTYKVKTPLSEHALYITINDIILNEGTTSETRQPFEVFINSKSMEHFQWIVALTRIVSAVFRKGGDITFLMEEFQSVFDPKGGYFKKGRYVPSIVAEIGDVIEQHLTMLGLYQKDTSLAKAAQAMVEEKQTKVEALMCYKCNFTAVVLLDGCWTCTNCGDSKCG